nr:serine/threonine-protein phosphatase 4 regulatory subunit 2-B [Ipomoea trifida]
MANQQEISIEESMRLLEAIAATGKFWHDWDKLKSILSFHLKQVLEDYPEAKMTNELQISSLGEPFPDLAKRLDDGTSSHTFHFYSLYEFLLVLSDSHSQASNTLNTATSLPCFFEVK